MFVSFFPRPKLFFWSALIWTVLSMALWYGYAEGLVAPSGTIGVALFWS
ncbi:MAG: peptide transporter, partial [Bradyrhizobium sp.]